MSSSRGGNTKESIQERRTRIIVMGAGLGALLGLISGYLYTRVAEEHGDSEAGTAGSVSSTQVLAVLVAIIGLVRQIAELGKPKKSDKREKK